MFFHKLIEISTNWGKSKRRIKSEEEEVYEEESRRAEFRFEKWWS
jgi:hypothetical protein